MIDHEFYRNRAIDDAVPADTAQKTTLGRSGAELLELAAGGYSIEEMTRRLKSSAHSFETAHLSPVRSFVEMTVATLGRKA